MLWECYSNQLKENLIISTPHLQDVRIGIELHRIQSKCFMVSVKEQGRKVEKKRAGE